MRRYSNGVLCVLLIMLILGCGGNRAIYQPSATPSPQVSADDARAALPPLPTGDQDYKRSQVVEGDTQPGSAAIDSLNGIAGASEMLLMLPEGEELAFAVYEIAARAEPPDYFTFNLTYYDGEPLENNPAEGYWVAYADYALGTWVFGGPFTTSQTRVEVPPAADVISEADNLYCAVLMMSGNVTMIHSVSASYYTDVGYESIWLNPPQGEFAGQCTDIQLNADGEPEIAYLRSDGWLDEPTGSIWIASREGDSWALTSVPTLYEVYDLVYRLGSNGRRALLAQTGFELHLLYDDGSGSFSGDYLVSADHNPINMPGMTFFNADADPEGDRDDLMIVYLEEDSWPDFFVRSYLYDGTNPPELQDVHIGSTNRIGRVSLTTNADNTLLLGELTLPAPGEYLLNTESYNEFGAWYGLPNVDWTGLPIEDDFNYNPAAATCELPDGNLAAAYRHEGGHGVVLGLSDGGDWQSESADTVGCRAYPVIDLEPYSDGSVGFLSTYADYHLQLFRKTPAGGDSVQVTAIDDELLDLHAGSMAVDSSDTTHIATSSANGEGLLYYTVDAEGVSERQVIDSGGWSQSTAYGVPAMLSLGDDLYVFYCDQAHSQLVYSLNRAGSWIAENEIIPTAQLAHVSWAAGYLENENLIYACFQNYLDYNAYVVTFTPGETDYQTNLLVPSLAEPLFVADDETNLGVAFGGATMILGNRMLFSLGPPRSAPHASEVVSTASDAIERLHPVHYNSIDQTWLAGCRGDDANSCLVHKRSPAGMWSGPYLVTLQPGAASAIIWAINSDDVTGINYVTVSEQVEGSTIRDVNVYVDTLPGRNFQQTATVMSFDTANYDVDAVVTAPAMNGWPVICLQVKPISDADWNYKVMTPEASYSWVSAFIWQTTCIDPASFPGMTVMDGNMPALAIIERDHGSDQRGRVLVRYPW